MTGSVKPHAKKVAKRVPGRRFGRNADRVSKLAAVRKGALTVGKVAFLMAKFVAGVALVVATAVGATALMPRHLRRQVIGDIGQIAAMTANDLSARARALSG